MPLHSSPTRRSRLAVGYPLLAGLALLIAGAGNSHAQSQPPSKPAAAPVKPAAPSPKNAQPDFSVRLREELDKLISGLTDRPRLNDAARESVRLFDLAIAYCSPEKDAQLFRDTAAAVREISQLAAMKKTDARQVLSLLAANPKLARTLALTLRADKPDDVYALLLRLAAKNPKAVSDSSGLAALVAAFCVVHDTPINRPGWNDQTNPLSMPVPIDPVENFGYFVSNRSKMLFDLDALAPELLVHIADANAPAAELEWALAQYKGNRTIGKVYSAIVYDTAAFKFGKPKKLYATDGYSLPNIKKVGGVCAEQAHYAANAARAIGDPAADVSVRGSDVSHAYVGYLRSAGGPAGRAFWDFDEGRYDEYEQIRGWINNPQTGKRISDGVLAISAGLLARSADEREQGIALIDAAERIEKARTNKVEYPPAIPQDWPKPRDPGRAADVPSQLVLLRAGVERCPELTDGWTIIARMAERKQLDAAQTQAWADAALALCGQTSQDFALEVLSPMVGALADPDLASRICDDLARRFNARPDLVAQTIFLKAAAWDKAEPPNPAKAWDAYKEVIARYPDDGTVIVDALRRAEALLDKSQKQEAAIPLYEDAFRRTSKPGKLSPGLERQSNWFRVGARYAALLEKAGRTVEAGRIRARIGDVPQQ